MTLHYAYFSGHLNTMETSLKRTVSSYFTNYRRVKIGITNNPERRAKHHKENGNWKRMIVKYYTTSDRHIYDMERVITAHQWDQVENEISSAGGPNGCAPYYLYVLVA